VKINGNQTQLRQDAAVSVNSERFKAISDLCLQLNIVSNKVTNSIFYFSKNLIF
jgi:hypothetical protein